MHPHRFRSFSTVALAVCALAVSAAPAAADDLSWPYNRSQPATPAQDLRSPDTRDEALIAQGLKERPTTVFVTTADRPVAMPADGMDWADAAIGAAAALGLVLLTAGTAAVVRRRSQRGRPLAA